jgi:ankyrin repeat protein
MLAASHGRLDMVQLLVEAGADVNIRDEDGSTSLMCAAEHGHAGIVKYLLHNPETDVQAKDNDGLTALAVAMEAGHRDLGVLLYANTSLSRGASPYTSARLQRPQSSSTSHSRTASPSTSSRAASRTLIPVAKAPVTPTPPQRTRRNSLNQ